MRQIARTATVLSFAICAALAPLATNSQTVPQAEPSTQMQHVEWSKSANIYEVNIRQYTSEGTFKAFAAHLPRLKKMGVDILWIMPM